MQEARHNRQDTTGKIQEFRENKVYPSHNPNPRILFVLCTLYFILFACTSKESPKSTSLIKVTDGLGRTIEIKPNPQRIISLCPSQTECLLEIIDSSQLIAVTTVCTFPENLIKNKPRINSYPIDFESIVKLKPDLVVSLKDMINPEGIKKLEQLHIPVLVQKVDSIEDIARNFEQLGLLFNKDTLASKVASQIRSLKKNKGITPKKSFLFLFSSDPLYAFGEGNFLNEIFVNNGFENIATLKETKVPYPIISREFILKKNPKHLFATSTNIINYVKNKYPETQNLDFFKNNKIDTINADICSRPTLRLIQIDSMLKNIHP